MSRSVVVIGAGAVGCLSALKMAAQGWDVTLVDQGHVGAVCACRRDAWSDVAEVVEVRAERDRRVVQRLRDRRGHRHQLGLAHRATVRWVVGKAGNQQLVRGHDMVPRPQAELLREP